MGIPTLERRVQDNGTYAALAYVPDTVAAFLDAMAAEGIHPSEPIADRLGPEFVRFHCEGDGKGKRNGWARLYLDDRPAGSFGNFRLNISRKWSSGTTQEMTLPERQQWAREIEEQKVRRELEERARQEHTAAKAVALWADAVPASLDHAYLMAKRIPGEGLRQSGDALIVPMRDTNRKIWNVQRIYPDGKKRFLKGGKKVGLYWGAGKPGASFCLGEGVATVCAVRRATGRAVAAAFDSGNLKAVALALRGKFPSAEIILLADDDQALVHHPRIKENLGMKYATEAAAAVAGRVAVPPPKDNTQ